MTRGAPCLFALQPDKTAPVGYKRDAIVAVPFWLRVAQRTNGAGPGSGSKANSQQLLDEAFRYLVHAGSVLHADQFFGNEEYIKHASSHGFDALTIMTNAKAARDGAFRVVDGNATRLASTTSFSRAEVEADLAVALNVSADVGDVYARLSKYIGAEKPPKQHAGARSLLKELATTVLDWHKVNAAIETWRPTPEAQEETTRAESLVKLVRTRGTKLCARW